MDKSNKVLVLISVGELIDKITILQIKEVKITDPIKLENVKLELRDLWDIAISNYGNILGLEEYQSLYHVNCLLWEWEENIRRYSSLVEFNEVFINTAKLIHQYNDRRFKIKSSINSITGSYIVEEKSY